MPFDPKPTKYPYPELTDGHYLVVKKDSGEVFDKDYDFIGTGRKYRFLSAIVRLGLNALVFPGTRLFLGLKVKGRENLKKHKDVLSNGFVTAANHVHLYDYVMEMYALRPRRSRILSWRKNLTGENKFFVRYSGGIPIPDTDAKASAAMVKSVVGYLKNGGWLHVCAEGSMWEYYMPIRPFKTGAAHFAYLAGVPVLPLAFSYREPKGLYKLFGKKALFTLTIGEPMYANSELSRMEAIEDLTKRLHEEVCRLAGIDPKDNIYPPVFNNTHRIDYY